MSSSLSSPHTALRPSPHTAQPGAHSPPTASATPSPHTAYTHPSPHTAVLPSSPHTVHLAAHPASDRLSLKFGAAKIVKHVPLGFTKQAFDLPNVVLMSGRSNLALTQGVAEYLGLPLGKVDLGNFPNGESSVEYQENLRNKDVVIVQSTTAPVNDNLNELFLMIEAARRADAKSITTVIPHYGYARQDRRNDKRQPISAAWVAKTLEQTGVTRVMLMDIHSTQVEGCFNGPVDNLQAYPALMSYLKTQNLLQDAVLVSPDEGGIKRVSKISKKYKLPWMAISKLRGKSNEIEEMTLLGGLNKKLTDLFGQFMAKAKALTQAAETLDQDASLTGNAKILATRLKEQAAALQASAEEISNAGELKGKTAIIFDDMIDTAGTLEKAAELLKANGAAKVIVCVTHGIFSGKAAERLQNPNIDEVVVSDTVPLPPAIAAQDKVTQVSSADIIGEAIGRLFTGNSIRELSELAASEAGQKSAFTENPILRFFSKPVEWAKSFFNWILSFLGRKS